MQEDATATFMGTVSFANNTVMETELPPVVYPSGGYSPQYIKKKGAALHNKVRMRSLPSDEYFLHVVFLAASSLRSVVQIQISVSVRPLHIIVVRPLTTRPRDDGTLFL